MNRNYSPGVSKLAKVLDGRMGDNISGVSMVPLDFGDIGVDYSLKLNNYSIPIPKGDYFILNTLNMGSEGFEFAETSSETHSHGPSGEHNQYEGNGIHSHINEGAHTHKVKLPDRFAKLLPGDRVLVCLVQNTYVVIGKIETSNNL